MLCLIVAVVVCSEQEISSTLVLHQMIVKSTNDEEKPVRHAASKSACEWACWRKVCGWTGWEGVDRNTGAILSYLIKCNPCHPSNLLQHLRVRSFYILCGTAKLEMEFWASCQNNPSNIYVSLMIDYITLHFLTLFLTEICGLYSLMSWRGNKTSNRNFEIIKDVDRRNRYILYCISQHLL